MRKFYIEYPKGVLEKRAIEEVPEVPGTNFEMLFVLLL
jgi:hypothetical protein